MRSKVLKNVGTAGLPGDGAPRQVGLVVLDRAASHDPRSSHRWLPDVQVWRKEGTIKHSGNDGKKYKDNDTSAIYVEYVSEKGNQMAFMQL